MRKILILSAAAAALGLFATMSAPADAANKASGVTAGQAVQMNLSARRYYHRYHHRYYGGPYYYYPYYYRPRYYPYGYYYPYYWRPGIYFGFGW